ncbi:MAG: dockerin type I repeat-containing protein [Oscillospiraceae bacterium]|nr:dockerin type I repeat-containing protein [Oscillospiraceae bacterium]
MKKKKIIAGALAVMTMAFSATGLTSYAEDFAEVVETEAVSVSAQTVEQLAEMESAGVISVEELSASTKVAEQIEELYQSGGISMEDVQDLQELLINAVSDSDSTSAYYPSCDKYYRYGISPTQHYMAIFNNKQINSGQAFKVYFYLNANIISGYDHVKNYECYPDSRIYRIIDSSYVSNTLRKVELEFQTGDYVIPAYSACIRFKIKQDDINGVLGTEYDLHRYTSESDTSPSINIDTTGDTSFIKCIYSMGDVNRDGTVDEKDASLVMKAVVELMIDNPGSPTVKYDKLAFNLAGDVTEDGNITVADCVAIKQYAKDGHF